MSFDSIESSVDLGRPQTFFEFVYGDGRGDVLRYVGSTEVLITGRLAPVIAMNRSWQARAIKHGKITMAGSLDKAAIEVTAGTDIELADLYRAAPPSRQVNLNIYRGNVGSDDYKRIWTGRVLSVSFDGPELIASCEPVSTSTRRVGLRRNYQYGCPHVLYGRACGLSRIANTALGEVIKVNSGQQLVFKRRNRSLVIAPAELVGGVLTITLPDGREVKRAIVAATGVDSEVEEEAEQNISIKLMAVVPELAVGVPTAVTRGCGHSWEACKAFGNTVNYGGCPNIPTKNPFSGNSF